MQYLRALARLRGDAGGSSDAEPWVTHDLRRVLRTKLAAFEVNDSMAECASATAARAVARIYNSLLPPQMRRALEAWAAELRRIMSPTSTATTR